MFVTKEYVRYGRRDFDNLEDKVDFFYHFRNCYIWEDFKGKLCKEEDVRNYLRHRLKKSKQLCVGRTSPLWVCRRKGSGNYSTSYINKVFQSLCNELGISKYLKGKRSKIFKELGVYLSEEHCHLSNSVYREHGFHLRHIFEQERKIYFYLKEKSEYGFGDLRSDLNSFTCYNKTAFEKFLERYALMPESDELMERVHPYVLSEIDRKFKDKSQMISYQKGFPKHCRELIKRVKNIPRDGRYENVETIMYGDPGDFELLTKKRFPKLKVVGVSMNKLVRYSRASFSTTRAVNTSSLIFIDSRKSRKDFTAREKALIIDLFPNAIFKTDLRTK